jgi:subtilisin family serine protease
MPKNILFSILFSLSFLLSHAQYNRQSQSLRQILQSCPSDTFLRINMVLHDQLNVYLIKAQMDQMNMEVKKRPAYVKKQLMQIADESQNQLISYLSQFPNQYRHIKQNWLVNMITMDIQASLIPLLAERSDIWYMEWDEANLALPIDPIEDKISQDKMPGGIEPGLQAINIPALWAMGYTGRGRVAFTMDTGIWPDHPTFGDRFLGNHLSMNSAWMGFDNPTPVDKGNSHGTHVTGTMLGLDRSTHDTIGSAVNAYFIVSDPVATSLATVKPISAFVDAFEWSFNPDGDTSTSYDIPDVINNSWGYGIATDTTLCTSYVSQAFDALQAAGIACVFSAGNEGPGDSTISIPHHINTGLVNSFTVGSISPHDTSYPISSFSSRGPSVCPASGSLAIKPEVVAPGFQIRSSVGKNSYSSYNGTSMASPHVSGAVILLREAFPQATGEEILLALYHSAHDLGIAGEDNTYGKGLIDALAAFNYLAQSYNPTPPMGNSYDLALVSISQPDGNISCDSILSPVVVVKNLGDSSIQNLNFEYSIDSLKYTQVWTGNLASGQSQTINLNSVAVSPGNQELIVRVQSAAQHPEGDIINNFRSKRINFRSHSTLPIYEDFEFNDLAKNGWYNDNPDGLRSWQVDTTGGHWGFRSAKMECYNYSPKANQKDALISPIFDTPASGQFSLIFDYAYQMRLSALADTLKVYMVSGCDLDNKVLIWEKGGQDLETFDSLSTYFIPRLASHWDSDTVDLSTSLISGPSLLMFETTNRMGNNIYMDNIRIFSGSIPPLSLPDNPLASIRMYPNPTEDVVKMDIPGLMSIEVMVMDLNGRLLSSYDFSGRKQVQIALPDEKGIYLIQLSDGKSVKNFKWVKL